MLQQRITIAPLVPGIRVIGIRDLLSAAPRILAGIMGRLILAILIVVGLDTRVLAEVNDVKIRTYYKYYDIKGATRKQLLDQVNSVGPGDGAVAVFWWNQLGSENVTLVNKKGKCGVRVKSFRFDVFILLPRWKAPRNADARMRGQWDRYLKGINYHENLHKTIFKRGARKWLRAVKLLRSKSTCKKMVNAYNAVNKKWSTKMWKEQFRFHRDESHTKYMDWFFIDKYGKRLQ